MIEERLKNLVVSGFGVKLTKRGDLIEVLDKSGSKKLISPHDLEQVIITGEASITSGVVRLLLERKVDYRLNEVVIPLRQDIWKT